MVILVRPVQPLNAELPMLVTEFGIEIVTIFLHPAKAEFPIDDTLFEIITSVMLAFLQAPSGICVLSPVNIIVGQHFLKAESPILVTELGIAIVFNPVQPSNAESPILVTPSGIVILVKHAQSQNAESPILLTELGISTFVVLLPDKALLGIAVVPFSKMTVPVQFSKACLPMFVTDLGIVILVRSVQPENAESPMLVTELGMVLLVRPVQPENA